MSSRLTLIVISNGWASGPDGLSVHEMARRAKALAAPIITIDPQQFVRNEPSLPADPTVTALLTTTAASLRALADRTGGLAILDSGDLNDVLDRVRKTIGP